MTHRSIVVKATIFGENMSINKLAKKPMDVVILIPNPC